MHVIIILFLLISRPAGQIPNSKRFMIHWRHHDSNKKETSGVTPQHHSTSLPLFPRFAEFPFCFFLPLQISFFQKSPTECVLRDGHETLTLRYGPIPCPFATQAMLGIYWRLLSMKRDVGSAHQGFADQLLQLIEMNPAIWRHDLRSAVEMNSQFLRKFGLDCCLHDC